MPEDAVETVLVPPTHDVGGVLVRRALPSARRRMVGPFVFFDHFGPTALPPGRGLDVRPHPHIGLATVTYLFDGEIVHRDSLGIVQHIRPGEVNWMTAGRGIVHSEMPQQKEGLMQGFQLWLNLPAAEKMKAAGYRDIQPEEIPRVALPDGGEALLIAGSLAVGDREFHGPVNTPQAPLSTDPLIAELRLGPRERFEQALPAEYNALVYPFEGDIVVGESGRSLAAHHAGLLSEGGRLLLAAGNGGARLLLLAGRPIGEPVVQYGPFVMNTAEEIEQTLRDYREGTLTQN